MAKRPREPTMPRSRADAPEPLKRLIGETRSRVAQHNVQGWYAELTRVYRLSVDHGLGLHTPDPRILVYNGAEGTSILQIAGPFATFTVNVNMPDKLLNAEFNRWLEEVRKQIKLPVAKPGRRGLNAQFDETKFNVWRETGIIEFADLLVWRATYGDAGKNEPSKSQLGSWIDRHTPKDVHTTERTLKAALASLPAILGQVEHEASQSLDAREAIAAQIEKDIARKPRLVIRVMEGKEHRRFELAIDEAGLVIRRIAGKDA